MDYKSLKKYFTQIHKTIIPNTLIDLIALQL